MSVEVEIKLKIREGDVTALKNALNSQGFVTGDTVIESDLYYTSTHHDFIRLDEALRVRTIETLRNGTVESVSSVLTYKGPKLDQRSMARKELETPSEMQRSVMRFLETSGSPRFHRFKKSGNISSKRMLPPVSIL